VQDEQVVIVTFFVVDVDCGAFVGRKT